MGNYDRDQTTDTVQIIEVRAGSATSDPGQYEPGSESATVTHRRNPYYYGAWILISLMIGIGILWIIGYYPGREPAIYADTVVVDPETGVPIYAPTYGEPNALGNLAELAPGLLFIGLTGALALLIVQGMNRRR